MTDSPHPAESIETLIAHLDDHWKAQCFDYDSMPEASRKVAQQCARDGFDEAYRMARDLLVHLQPHPAVEEEKERAFKAGFLAGVNCVDKFGEQQDTPEDAYADYLKADPPPSAERRAQQLIADLLEERADDLTKESCDNCPDCGPMIMCRYHSVLSALAGRTWAEPAIQRGSLDPPPSAGTPAQETGYDAIQTLRDLEARSNDERMALAEAIAALEERVSLQARAVVAEHHNALALMSRGPAQEQIERELRIKLAESEVARDAQAQEIADRQRLVDDLHTRLDGLELQRAGAKALADQQAQEIARLREQVKEYARRSNHAKQRQVEWAQRAEDAEAQIATLREKVVKLKAYAFHDGHCACIHENDPCDCGLLELLALSGDEARPTRDEKREAGKRVAEQRRNVLKKLAEND